jgi:hypothetical protein
MTGRASASRAGRWPAVSRLARLSRCACTGAAGATVAVAANCGASARAERRTGCACANTAKGTAVTAPFTRRFM